MDRLVEQQVEAGHHRLVVVAAAAAVVVVVALSPPLAYLTHTLASAPQTTTEQPKKLAPHITNQERERGKQHHWLH